jgi:hypothetical protein
VAQTITNSGVALHGMSPMETQIEYVGTTLIPAVLTLGDTTNGEQNNQITGIFLYGDNANATDGMLVRATFHSQFRDVWTWGVTGCGIDEQHGITNTFDTPRTSSFDAATLGINNSGHSTPASAFCSNQNTVGSFTGPSSDSTLINPAAEGVTGAGINLNNTINISVLGGTSEDNPIGVELGVNTQNCLISTMDLESNTVNDILDNGDFNTMLNDDMADAGATGGALGIGANSRFIVVSGGGIASITHDPAALAPYILSGGQISIPGGLIGNSQIGGNWGVGGTLNVTGVTTLTNELDIQAGTLAGPVLIGGTGTGQFNPIDMVAPNMATGQDGYICLGLQETANNCAQYTFNNVGGLGSASNTMGIGIFDDLQITIDTAANVSTAGTVTAAAFKGSASTQPATCTVGELWTNPAATSASTVLAVCFPANTFTFVTVP